jgi:hypothetical protein
LNPSRRLFISITFQISSCTFYLAGLGPWSSYLRQPTEITGVSTCPWPRRHIFVSLDFVICLGSSIDFTSKSLTHSLVMSILLFSGFLKRCVLQVRRGNKHTRREVFLHRLILVATVLLQSL